MKSNTEKSNVLFSELELIDPLLRSLEGEGYTQATAIQTLGIPPILEGRDVLGWAQTGTGKTAAFALPILQKISENQPLAGEKPKKRAIQALVLAPTRELAQQIEDSFRAYGKNLKLRSFSVYGGVGMQKQIDALRQGLDILIATPGRLLDLMSQGYVSFSQLKILVLDEADHMLDMGFIHDIRKIVGHLPQKRQTLLFSATMAAPIKTLAEGLLKDPVRVEVAPVSSTAEAVTQSLFYVEKKDKSALLKSLIEQHGIKRALVFTRTKHMANRITEFLQKSGIGTEAIHSNKSQNARNRALDLFKKGQIHILVATDIAARGIDVDDISHVFNYDLPNESETYVHRIGRTGRAGASGIAFSFCSSEERELVGRIERTIKKKLPLVTGHAFCPGSGLVRPALVQPAFGGDERGFKRPTRPLPQRSAAPGPRPVLSPRGPRPAQPGAARNGTPVSRPPMRAPRSGK